MIRRLKSFLSIFFLFFIFSVSVSGLSVYPYVGYENYFTGFGLYDLTLETTFSGKGLTLGSGSPILCDIDDDGIQEIVVNDKSSIKFYNTINLKINNSWSKILPADHSVLSNLICYDINGDSNKDIIYFMNTTEGGYIRGIYYNGSEMKLSVNFSVEINLVEGSRISEGVINCQHELCAIAVYSKAQASFLDQINIISFNQSQVIFNDYSRMTAGALCLPHIKSMPLVDVDNDGLQEFVIGGYATQDVGDEGFWVDVFNMNASGFINFKHGGSHTYEDTIYDSEADMEDYYNEVGCFEENLGFKSSGVTVGNFDGVTGDGLEIMISIINNVGDGTAKVYQINGKNFNVEKDYPDTLNGFSADFLSNIVEADVFYDTDDDWCVMGFYEEDGKRLSLFCGNENKFISSISYGSIENYLPPQNAHGVYSNMIHSIYTPASFDEKGHDATEIATTYGIFELYGDEFSGVDYWTCKVAKICTMEIVFGLGEIDSAVIFADIQNTGFNDLFYLKNDSINSLSDEFENSGCSEQNCITQIEICPSSPWLQNTTVEFNLNFSEVDGDLLTYNLTIYAGKAYSQSLNWSNVTSGSIRNPFIYPETLTPFDSWRISIYDSENPSDIFAYVGGFTVSNVGNEWGDTCFTIDYVPVDDDVDSDGDGIPDSQEEDDAVTQVIDDFASRTNLTRAFLWFLVMVIVGIVIMVSAKSENPTSGEMMVTGGVVAFLELVLLIMGVLLNFISVGYIIIFVIFGLVAIGLLIVKIFFGRG